MDYFSDIHTAADSAEQGSGLGEIVTAKHLVSSEVPVPFFSKAIRVLPDRDIHAELTILWHSALLKWQQVFEIMSYPGPVGSALFAEQLSTEIHTDSVVLRDSLGIKSQRTAIKRAQTLLRFMSWMQTEFNDCLQWDRNRVLQYLNNANSSATKGTTLMEAFRFAKYVIFFCSRDCCLCAMHQSVKERRHAKKQRLNWETRPNQAKTKTPTKNATQPKTPQPQEAFAASETSETAFTQNR